MLKLTSLNLNGLRSATTKGLEGWLETSRPDCVCVQEIRVQAADVLHRHERLGGLEGHFHFAVQKGYAGVGIYTRHAPSDVIRGFGSEEFDAEGRCLELRFDTPARKLSILSCYFPSGSAGEHRQAAKFRFLDLIDPHLARLKTEREFILCGDINIAHQRIDLKNWKSNQKNSGFTREERAWMSKLLGETGLVDVYRKLQPDATDAAYTWWSNRAGAYAKNVGWRIDYQLATAGVAATARKEEIYLEQRFSDHAPLIIDYDFML